MIHHRLFLTSIIGQVWTQVAGCHLKPVMQDPHASYKSAEKWTNGVLSSVWYIGANVSENEKKYSGLHPRKWIWKCHLQDFGHFIQAILCWIHCVVICFPMIFGKYRETWTKWLPFCRRYFQMHVLNENARAPIKISITFLVSSQHWFR